MNMVINLATVRRERQLKYERDMLKEFSLDRLKTKYKLFAKNLEELQYHAVFPIEEYCYDIAVEAYILGAHYSRFYKYGESTEQVQNRCIEELSLFSDQLLIYLIDWMDQDTITVEQETLYILCEAYIAEWWMEGYMTGQRRYKMRLH